MAPFRDLSPLLNPRSVAVVGASERPGSAGRLVLENLQQLNYPGKVYAVNPAQERVLGLPCFPDLRSLPEQVEMAAILLGADKVLPALATGIENGVKAAWVLASGFAEAGPEGEARQAELARLAAETGLLVCGPNCVGVLNLAGHFAAYSVALSPATPAGSVSAVVQSGAIAMGLANSARIGFRCLVSSGNEAVLSSADYIGFLVNDPGTKVIVAFLEGVRHPEKFIAAARAASDLGKPIIVIKAGKSESARRTIQAHTGSLAGSDGVLDKVFRKYGVVRVGSLDELTEAVELFVNCPLPQSEGVGILSLSGGQIGLIADMAQDLGLNFPPLSDLGKQALSQVLPPYSPITNPLDAWGTGDLEKTYPECVAIVAREPQVSLVAAARDTSPAVAQREVDQSLQVARALVKARRETGKPVVMFSNVSTGFQADVHELLEAEGVPYLQGTAETLRAIQAFEKYAAYRRHLENPEPTGSQSPLSLSQWKTVLQRKGTLSELEGRRLLADYGIPGPREQVARDEAEACLAAQRIGFPVVLKILSPDIHHKTEAGGVRVGLQDQAMVATAFGQIMESARRYKPDARLEGVIVQEMIPAAGVEVILGILRDDDFGPVVVYGSGGVLVELVKDSVLGLPPFGKAEAQRLIESTRGVALLRPFRGRPAADINALATALVSVSQLAVDLSEEIMALDINPLMVLPEGQGVCAVDVLIEIG